jgi:hypothetical protein
MAGRCPAHPSEMVARTRLSRRFSSQPSSDCVDGIAYLLGGVSLVGATLALVGQDVDQMWTRDTESVIAGKPTTL